ncbi:hypothetical protein OsI_03316 [Oryza sativa Indica Group]|uniref:Uncharacterized protein n=1 Tax=Oryza sativa subsp. indica TaxID=39946 RepID=A2WTW7_ORYSI|nr:hypothetical protein OsI_03316 [Oryza sativa Indica Group]
MPESSTNRFCKKVDLEVLPSRSDVGESSYHKHSLWMAHWARSSISPEPQNGQSCSPLKEIDDVGYSKDCGALPFELMKARVAERLMVGVSHGGVSAGNTRQFSTNMRGVARDVCQEVQCKNVDQMGSSFESSVMQKNVNLYAAKTVVSERYSVHKISDILVDSRKLCGTENLSSEWNHFPMFEINRKIDSILNPRRSALVTSSEKIFVPQKSVKINMSTSNVMSFSSKEYQLHTHQVTDENRQCKSARGMLSHLDNYTGLNSDHAGKKLKGHLSIEEPCSCSKDDTDSSCSLADEHHARHYIPNSKKSPHRSCKNSSVYSASKMENQFVEGSLLEHKSEVYGACKKKQHLEGVAFHESALHREHEIKSVKTTAITNEGDMDTNGHHVDFGNLLQSDQQYLNKHTEDSAVNLTESCKTPDAIDSAMILKSKDESLAQEKRTNNKLIDNKRKGPCLFEMFTQPTKSNVKCSIDRTSSGKSCGNMTSGLLGAQKQFSTKTDTFYSEAHHASKSTAGFASASMQKDLGYPFSAKTEQLVTSSVKGVSIGSKGNEAVNTSAEHRDFYPKATCVNNQEWSMSKTSSMNLDLVLFQISRLKNPIPNALNESPACPDPSEKWLKRLQHDTSDSHVPCSKKPKVGDGPLAGGTCTVFGQVFDCDSDSTGMINHVKNKLICKGLTDQQSQEGSPMSAKSLNRWIGRWCRGGTPVFHGTSNLERQEAKSGMPSDDLEGQFPSIAAMAMMGRVMNKLRPCELQKRGPSVVWRTEGL